MDKITEEIRSDKAGRLSRQKAYLASLRKDLDERIIKKLNLDDLHKEFLRLRWLDQVLWMEQRANNTKVLYYILRLTTIICGVIIPALVGTRLVSGVAITWVTWVVFVLSLLVAISAALEEFLRYGEQWRHYRLKVELLKNEGWLFFQLSGRHYRDFSCHAKAYPQFARRVERWNRLEVDEYLTDVVQDKGDEDEDEDNGKGTANRRAISSPSPSEVKRSADKRHHSR